MPFIVFHLLDAVQSIRGFFEDISLHFHDSLVGVSATSRSNSRLIASF